MKVEVKAGPRLRGVFALLGVGLIALVFAACGSDSGESTQTTQTGASQGTASGSKETGSTGGDTARVAPGIPTLAELYAGTETPPPTEGPKPIKGKNVWWISCG